MRKYLVFQITKFLNGEYATRVVAEYTDREEARDDAQQRNESNTNRNHYYKVYIISHPLLTI